MIVNLRDPFDISVVYMLSGFAEKLARIKGSLCDKLSTPEMAQMCKVVACLKRTGLVEKSLQQDETAPNFTFVNNKGEQQTLYQLLEAGPVVINFFRGYWCTFCVAELEAFEEAQAGLERFGANYLAISPQQDIPVRSHSDHGHLVKDCDNHISRQFGLTFELDKDQQATFSNWGLKLSKMHQSDKWELPVPATYIISQDRRVAFRYVDVDYRKRFDPSQISDLLQAL